MIADGRGIHALFLALYLIALIAVGAWKARKVKSQADFSLAGRGLSTPVLIGTLLATWIGTGSLFSNAEETVRVGIDAFFLPIAGGLGILFLVAIAARLRRFGQFTIQDILEARFGVTARVLGTLTLVLAYVIIVSYQYRAGAAVLTYLFPGLEAFQAVCTVALFVILYTALAGMFSVAYTDVANGLLMLLGIACALPLLWSQAGGLESALATLPEPNGRFFGHYTPAVLISSLLPAFLLMVGDANMVQRFFSARDPRSARRAAVGMFFGVLLLECAILAVALFGSALVASGAVEPPAQTAHIILHLAFEALPAWLGALLVGTAVAIVVSTADSYLLSPATSLVRDVYQRFVEPEAPDSRTVLVGRLVVVGLGLVALLLSTLSDKYFHVALFAYTIYGAGITPALLAAYFWRRATPAGAVASIVTGVGTACIWKGLAGAGWQAALAGGGWEWLADLGAWAAAERVDAVIPAALLSTLTLVVVSLAGAPPTDERRNAF